MVQGVGAIRLPDCQIENLLNGKHNLNISFIDANLFNSHL